MPTKKAAKTAKKAPAKKKAVAKPETKSASPSASKLRAKLDAIELSDRTDGGVKVHIKGKPTVEVDAATTSKIKGENLGDAWIDAIKKHALSVSGDEAEEEAEDESEKSTVDDADADKKTGEETAKPPGDEGGSGTQA